MSIKNQILVVLDGSIKLPKIDFGKVHLNEYKIGKISVKNTFNFQVEVKVSSFLFDDFSIKLSKNQEFSFDIRWSPIKTGRHNFIVKIESITTNKSFFVHYSGEGVDSNKKLAHRTYLQDYILKTPLTKNKFDFDKFSVRNKPSDSLIRTVKKESKFKFKNTVKLERCIKTKFEKIDRNDLIQSSKGLCKEIKRKNIIEEFIFKIN